MNSDSPFKKALYRLQNTTHAADQMAALASCSHMPLNDPVLIKAYHKILWLLCAYPYNEKIHHIAQKEINRLVQVLYEKRNNRRWQKILYGSGLPYTELSCQYSAGLLQWLLQRFPGDVKPDEPGDSGAFMQQLAQAILPGVEFHSTTQGCRSIWGRIKLLSGHYKNEAALQWLLQLIKKQAWSPVLKDLLYDRLKIFVRWKLNEIQYSRIFFQSLNANVVFRKPAQKKVNSFEIVKQPISKPVSLSKRQKQILIDTARASLALHFRETEPVTYADTDETFLFDMGGGMLIALIGMEKERRLSLESYIGFMAFKNAVPVAYGGGWIWGKRCKIGINIYPPFRGMESDMLFCQVLRLYYQQYKVGRFVVKPYQFGKGNPEGLRSGAFWFYYKLGFRPVSKAIQKTAAAEWEKKHRDKTYRTPLALLKRFTACHKEWQPVNDGTAVYNADDISIAITRMIREQYGGNREKATGDCMKKLKSFLACKKRFSKSGIEKKVWENWSLLFAVLPGTSSWTRRQRNEFLHLLHLKAAGSEKDFILALQKHSAFWTSIKNLFHWQK